MIIWCDSDVVRVWRCESKKKIEKKPYEVSRASFHAFGVKRRVVRISGFPRVVRLKVVGLEVFYEWEVGKVVWEGGLGQNGKKVHACVERGK